MIGELVETVRGAVEAAYNCGCNECEAERTERIAALDGLAALLEAHRAEFLATYRLALPSPDGVTGAAEACLADFERDVLQHASPGRNPEAVQATEGMES